MMARLAFRTALQSAAVGSAIIGVTHHASAQEIRSLSPLQLPRPSYESHPLQLGPVSIQPELVVTESYDDNVFATARSKEDDFVTSVSPTVNLSAGRGKLDLSGRLSATVTEFADHEQEGSTTFAGNADARYALDRASQVGASISYARLTESRADPESTRSQDESPATYETMSSSVSYAYRRNRLGVSIGAAAGQVDYASDDESDRDRYDYSGSVRGTLTITPRFDAYVEAYAERRDFVDAVDRSGLDRDAVLAGFYLGTVIAIASKWSGEVGVGLFRTYNDDDALPDFTGIGTRGSLTWSITPRTAVTAGFAREDIPTVTPGASGLIESRVTLRLDQEIRHNLIASAEVGYLRDDYQERDRQLSAVSGQVTAEYLINRNVSAVFSAGYTERTADIAADEYDRFTTSVALRFKL